MKLIFNLLSVVFVVLMIFTGIGTLVVNYEETRKKKKEKKDGRR